MNKSNIVLYSKFSPYSRKFIELANSIGLNFTYLCIDNKETRNRIIKNKQLDIKNLPCLLVVYEHGTIEKYQGEDAFIWINNLIQQNNQLILQQQQIADLQNKLQEKSKPEQRPIEEEEEDVPEPPPMPKQFKDKFKKKTPIRELAQEGEIYARTGANVHSSQRGNF